MAFKPRYIRCCGIKGEASGGRRGRNDWYEAPTALLIHGSETDSN